MNTPDPAEPISLQQALDEFLAGMADLPRMSLEELAGWSERMAAREAAELAARGIVPVSVVHGDPESAEDEQLHHSLHRLAAEAGPYCATIGGNDYTTWHFCGPNAENDALVFIGLADRIARPWWTITRTAHPVYR